MFLELFPEFNFAKITDNLLSIWLGVGFFRRFADCFSCAAAFSFFSTWFLLCAADFSLSNSGMFAVSGCSSGCPLSDFERGLKGLIISL